MITLPDILRKNNLPALIIALLCSFFVFPCYFEFLVFPTPNSGETWRTLDPSWKLILGQVTHSGADWGHDLILTYGPLSYLSTRLGWGLSRFSFLLFDLFVWFNFAYIFYTSLKQSANKLITMLLILSATLVLPVYFGSGTSLLLLAFMVFWVRQSLDENKPLFYVMQIALCVLLFFMKFNTGFIALAFFLISLLYRWFSEKERRILPFIYLISCCVLILALCQLLNVSLLPYIHGGLELISGHNSSMYYDEGHNTELWFSIVIIALSLLIFLVQESRSDLFKYGITLSITALCLYLLYKQAFTRADIKHVSEFYRYVLLFVLCAMSYSSAKRKILSGVSMLVVICITLFFITQFDSGFLHLGDRLSKSNYIAGFRQFSDSSGIHLYPNNNQIPRKIRSRIGTKSIDVYPWNAQWLIENRLNYRPRPVPQSYLAYTPYLERMNAEFYQSSQAPDHLLYEFDAIDRRYPLFDEPLLHLALLKNYHCADTFSYAGRLVLLLEKNKNIQPVRLKKLKEYELQLTDPIVPQAGIYYELQVQNTMAGSAVSLFSHAPELSLCITTNGKQQCYRTSPPVLATGIFSNQFFSSTSDVFDLLNGNSPATARITSYSLQPAHASWFKNKMRVTEYTIN